MISKGRGLALRLSVVLHILFQLGSGTTSSNDTVSDEAIEAAIDFVMVVIQQVAYIAGRGELDEELKRFSSTVLVNYYRSLVKEGGAPCNRLKQGVGQYSRHRYCILQSVQTSVAKPLRSCLSCTL